MIEGKIFNVDFAVAFIDSRRFPDDPAVGVNHSLGHDHDLCGIEKGNNPDERNHEAWLVFAHWDAPWLLSSFTPGFLFTDLFFINAPGRLSN